MTQLINWLSENRTYAVIGLMVALLLSGFLAYTWKRVHDLDVAAQKVIVWVSDVDSYTQYVETEVSFPDRALSVIGTHYTNRKEGRFAAHSTTTLTIPDESSGNESNTFTFHNIAIGDDVYTKIETDSPLLQKTIPHSPEWRHFTRTTIPEAFQSISIPGPILDNLKLFSEGGSYVSIAENKGPRDLNGQPCTHYTFKLSGKTPDPGGPLPAILDRIGKNGTVDICASEEGAILEMRFESESYRSRTLISDINSIPPIVAPLP